ncbi:gag/pol protein [Cucumis melo var. makuwa]|uniref:Gag/pol protein n=1 Tax=Cucumis melo var. makuwa TaxID=1194695 RepID=A0A5D3D523_CUCMM|nr:gag/pol protein [Cucumis melo var. makuwa]TYK18638.1 gag/pol protein [Cucumis melo var. makuwa]
MNSSIVQLLASKKLNGDNYAAWKSNLNTILVVDDLRFVLTEKCPQTPASNANRASREVYDRWIKENEKTCLYILASMSDVLAKKHKSLATAKEIMDSLKGMFGQPEWSLTHEAIKYIYTKHMKKGTSVREHVLDMMMHFNIAEVNGGAIDKANQIEKKEKRKTSKENKDKNTPEKGKSYHCGENGHWLRNCPKYLAQKKKNSSWKRFSEGEITLKVETGEMVSAKAVGDFKIGRLVKSRLLSQLEDNSLPPSDSCLEGKMTKRSFTGKGLRAKTPLELVHSDLCGPMNVKARGGYEYFISFIDDYSRYGHVYLIQNKSDSVEKFKKYKAEVENESETPIYIFNNVLSKSVSETPNEIWKGRKGYPKESKGGLFYDPQENKVFVSTNATFLEEDHIRNHQTRSKLVLEEICKNTTDRPSSSTKVVDKTRNIGQTRPSQELGEPRRSGRVAMNDVDCDQWIKAIDLKMELMYSNIFWTLVDQQNDVNPIGCKWIYKRKRDQAGKVQTFKAQLVAKGYTQKEGIYYEETFSPVAMIKSIRILLSIATFYDYEIWQMDVKNKRIINSTVAFLVLYVDDILLIGNDVGHLTDIKKWLATQFQMKDLGNAQYVLGIQIVRNRKNKTLAMSQTSYIDKMLSRYKMHNSKKGLLSYRYGIHLSKEQCSKTPQEVEDMSNIPYASTVGSLMYAMLYTRSDMYYSVGIVSRYKSNPGRDHWTTVKNILKYFIRKKDYMLVYSSKDLILTGYTDFNFQTDKDARKSTSGLVFTLNGGAVV